MNYGYDNIGQLKSAQGFDRDNTPRLHEQFGYAYDKAWNLTSRTNNALVTTFGVNNLNELTGNSRAGTLTVAGTATETNAGSGNGVTNVTVSGTGLSSGSANLYADGTWARPGATLANGTNSYTATALDTYGRQDTSTVAVNLPATNGFAYDLNGNLLSDGNRNFACDDENQLTSVWVTNVWRSDFFYDGLMRRRIRREYLWQSGSWNLQAEIHYVYDGMLVVEERWFVPSSSGLVAQNAIIYTRGNDLSGTLQGAGGIGGLLARSDNGQMLAGLSSAHACYHCDGSGNVTALVATNGTLLAHYTYDPFGNILSMSGPLATANLYRFSSKEWHPTSGLVYYGYRLYDPNLQRWVNRDPVAEQGGANLYVCFKNNPIEIIDFLGLRFYPSDFIGPLQPGDVRCPPAPPGASLYQNMQTAEFIGSQQPSSINPEDWANSLALGNTFAGAAWFYTQVKTGGPWDYKNGPYPNAQQYDPFGNFKYGAAGHAAGWDDWTLQNEAGIANQNGGQGAPGSRFDPGSGIPPYGDRPQDNDWIKKGIDYAKQYPSDNGPGPCN